MALEGLAQPDTLTTGLAVFFFAIYGLTVYLAIKMYSALSIIVWGFSVIALVFAIILGIDFMLVWVSIIFLLITEMISMVLFVVYGSGV